MNSYFVLLFCLLSLGCFSQTSSVLSYNQKWPNTIVPVILTIDTTTSEPETGTAKKLNVSEFTLVCHWNELYLLKKQTEKSFLKIELCAIDLGEIWVPSDALTFVDLNGDGHKEIQIKYNVGFSEYHYESGGSDQNSYTIYIDTSTLIQVLGIQTRLEMNSTDVAYKDEEINGRNSLTDYVVVSKSSSAFEIEYVIRNKNGWIEIVCNRMKKSGDGYKDFIVMNKGITKYKWENYQWIKLQY